MTETQTKPEPATLDLGAPPRWRDQGVDIDEIRVEAFGSPPSDELVRQIGIAGVLVPILVREHEIGGYEVIDGRRRVLAAIRNGIDEIPARVQVSGDVDLFPPAIALETNDAASPNPIVELEAIEELIRQVPGIALPQIAKATGVRLATLRARIRLSSLRSELREAWKAGKFGTKVGEAAARCDDIQQNELVAVLNANDTLTEEDVKRVRKGGVQGHLRTARDDRWKERATELLEKAKKDLYLSAGESARDAIDAIEAAVKLIEELDG